MPSPARQPFAESHANRTLRTRRFAAGFPLAATLAVLALAPSRALPADVPAAPVPAYPGDQAVNVTVYATLKWKPVAGAVKYHVQLDTVPTFAAPLAEDSAVADTSFKLARLADSTRYCWRVRAANASGFGAWSKLRAFTTTPPLSGGPVIVSPGYGDEGTPLSPTLVWNAVAGAKTYTVQLSFASNFDSLVYSKTDVADTALKVTGLQKDQFYFWHVRANTTPVYTAWSKSAFATTTPATVLRKPERGAQGRRMRVPTTALGRDYRADGRIRYTR